MIRAKSPSEVYPELAVSEKRLNNLVQDSINIGQEMVSIAGGKFYIPDMFFIAVLNRSINLIDAILVLNNRWNFVAAGALIRLHLDTLLCVSYLRTTTNPDAFIRQVLEGKEIRKIQDEYGEKLTDTRLRHYAKELFPQIDSVYKETSRLVHFSNKHFFICVGGVDQTNRTAELGVAKGSTKWSEADITSLLKCAIAITEPILAIVRGWIVQKARMCNISD